MDMKLSCMRTTSRTQRRFVKFICRFCLFDNRTLVYVVTFTIVVISSVFQCQLTMAVISCKFVKVNVITGVQL